MILALTESTVPLSVRSLGTLLIARMKQEKLMIYGQHLLYLDVKRHYKGVTEPKDFCEELFSPKREQKPDNDIIPDLIKRLGGEES